MSNGKIRITVANEDESSIALAMVYGTETHNNGFPREVKRLEPQCGTEFLLGPNDEVYVRLEAQ